MQFWSPEIEKQVGQRVQTVLEDPYLIEAFTKFGGGILRRSSVFHGLDAFLRQQKVRGATCFEVGTWNGLTAAILSRYFDRVVTVDVAHNAIKRDVLAHLGIKNVHCIDIISNEDKPAVWEGIRRECDFSFLDGDHANDTSSDFALVHECGRVLFHETWPFQLPVWQLVHSLPYNEVTHGGMGLALWERGK